MESSLRTLVERSFKAVEAKDFDAALSVFADDALLVDPHYPNPRMHGKAAIAEGLRWGFAGMRTFGFTLVNYFESSNGRQAAVEMATHHVLKTGMKLDFPQMFVIEATDGRITRMQAYEPYGPGGIGGLILGITRLKRKVARRGTRVRR